MDMQQVINAVRMALPEYERLVAPDQGTRSDIGRSRIGFTELTTTFNDAGTLRIYVDEFSNNPSSFECRVVLEGKATSDDNVVLDFNFPINQSPQDIHQFAQELRERLIKNGLLIPATPSS